MWYYIPSALLRGLLLLPHVRGGAGVSGDYHVIRDRIVCRCGAPTANILAHWSEVHKHVPQCVVLTLPLVVAPPAEQGAML